MVGAMYSPELYTGTTTHFLRWRHGDARIILEVFIKEAVPLFFSVPGFPYQAAAAAASTAAATFRGAHLRGRARPVYSAVRAAVPQPAIPTYPG